MNIRDTIIIVLERYYYAHYLIQMAQLYEYIDMDIFSLRSYYKEYVRKQCVNCAITNNLLYIELTYHKNLIIEQEVPNTDMNPIQKCGTFKNF